MKTLWIIILTSFLISCHQKDTVREEDSERKIVPEFQDILDSAQVVGAILVYDLNNRVYYSNNFDWTVEGKLPASTFKIPNSIIALETGVVKDEKTMCRWDGEDRALDIWEKDMIFREAFHLSCVPCYQEIARKIGVARMNQYLKQLDYGSMVVDSSSIDNFWLQGQSVITMVEQLAFLKRLYQSALPITERTETMMKKLMIIEERSGYVLRGKTGWSIRNGNNNGWYVGYLEGEKAVYFFAVNIEPEESFKMDLFPKIRKEVAEKAFAVIGIK